MSDGTRLEIHCTQCGFNPGPRSSGFICPVCGGYFDYLTSFDYYKPAGGSNQPGIWRYKSSFGLHQDVEPISLGEGNTPLVWDGLEGKQIAFKLDYINPTGSYKDRGTTLLISYLHWLGEKLAIEDSSGNAGASFAAYCSRAGIKGKVYIPDYASGPKRKQIEAYGCEVVPIKGPRSRAAEAVKLEAERGVVYASHVYQPYVLAGYASAAYEIYEQLGEAPGSIVVPAGQGSFLLGIGRGFEALKKGGFIHKLPQLVGVQSQACAPLWAVFQSGSSAIPEVPEGDTLAEGIRINHPLRADQVLGAIRSSGGWISAVREQDILTARDELAGRGFYVEPTSAVVWPALTENIDRLREPIVLVMTGSGLKSGEN